MPVRGTAESGYNDSTPLLGDRPRRAMTAAETLEDHLLLQEEHAIRGAHRRSMDGQQQSDEHSEVNSARVVSLTDAYGERWSWGGLRRSMSSLSIWILVLQVHLLIRIMG